MNQTNQNNQGQNNQGQSNDQNKNQASRDPQRAVDPDAKMFDKSKPGANGMGDKAKPSTGKVPGENSSEMGSKSTDIDQSNQPRRSA